MIGLKEGDEPFWALTPGDRFYEELLPDKVRSLVVLGLELVLTKVEGQPARMHRFQVGTNEDEDILGYVVMDLRNSIPRNYWEDAA